MKKIVQKFKSLRIINNFDNFKMHEGLKLCVGKCCRDENMPHFLWTHKIKLDNFL